MNGKDLVIHTALGVITTQLLSKPLEKYVSKMKVSAKEKEKYILTGKGFVMGSFLGDYMGQEINNGSSGYTLKERGLSIFLGGTAAALAAYTIGSFVKPNSSGSSGGSGDDDDSQDTSIPSQDDNQESIP